MFDGIVTNATGLVASLPAAEATIPFVGALNLTPYLLALSIFIGITLFTKLVLVVVLARLREWSKKTSTDIDDTIIEAIAGIRLWVYSLVAAYVALNLFTLPTWFETTFSAVVYIAVMWQVIEVALRFVSYGTRRLVEKDDDGDGITDPNAATASDMINLMARIALYAFGFIFVLSNLGIEVTSLIAGLGIGGIAIAFALQGILSDLFASFSIYFDKPFRIGDFIIIGTDMGVVEKIGIKTTRLRTLQGEELVVSNAELTTARVQNFKKMEERRIVMEFGIAYETPRAQVRAVDGIVKGIFENLSQVRLDRVHFKTFGDSALIFEVVYFVETSDYNQYMDQQQEFNFALYDAFAEQGIDFAYPTQTIYTKSLG